MLNKLIVVAISLFVLSPGLFAQYFYINVYGDTGENGRGIFVKSIDLNSKNIVNSLKIADHGVIWLKEPISVDVNDGQYLISFVENGGYCKNSQLGLDNYTVYYSILSSVDGRLNLAKSDSIIGATISYLKDYKTENGFRLELKSDDNSHDILPIGLYGLSEDLNFIFENTVSSLSEPGRYTDLRNYEYLQRLSWPNVRNLYFTYPYSFKIIKLNNDNDESIDSLRIPVIENQLTQFVYHPLRDKLYVFNLNYEIHGEFTNTVRNPMGLQPRVMIYNPESLELLATHFLPDYPDGDYPSGDDGVSGVVGDFIVYYFFDSDWIYKFNPAMLFIFDTRTNEATWLRVGWR